jgi:hypothetical protein
MSGSLHNPLLRLLPISSGNFSGNWARDMPEMTMSAIFQAVHQLGDSTKRRNMHIDLCIWNGTRADEYLDHAKEQCKEILGQHGLHPVQEAALQGWNGQCGPRALVVGASSAGVKVTLIEEHGSASERAVNWTDEAAVRKAVLSMAMLNAQKFSNFVLSTQGMWEKHSRSPGTTTWESWIKDVVRSDCWFRPFEMALFAQWLETTHESRLVIVEYRFGDMA